MTKWHTISAKFSPEEKKVLDILRDNYDLSHNQSLRNGLNILARVIAMSEYYVSGDSRVMKKVNRIGKKKMKEMDSEIKQMLKDIPQKIQDSEYEKFSEDSKTILGQFDKIFVERKRGRPKEKKSRGRPKEKGLD